MSLVPIKLLYEILNEMKTIMSERTDYSIYLKYNAFWSGTIGNATVGERDAQVVSCRSVGKL